MNLFWLNWFNWYNIFDVFVFILKIVLTLFCWYCFVYILIFLFIYILNSYFSKYLATLFEIFNIDHNKRLHPKQKKIPKYTFELKKGDRKSTKNYSWICFVRLYEGDSVPLSPTILIYLWPHNCCIQSAQPISKLWTKALRTLDFLYHLVELS